MELIDKMFVEGIAHDEQWTFPAKEIVNPYDRENVLRTLRSKFSPEIALIHQLPVDDGDTLRAAFYNVTENWFYQLLHTEGYDGKAVAKTIQKWLQGDINTLVLCGGSLSNAKLLYNVLTACFPLAVTDQRINSLTTLHKCSTRSSLYCLPFVDAAPDAVMLHLMEGNSTACLVDGELLYVKSCPMLIHCLDLTLAKSFIARNVAVLFLTQDQSYTPHCYNARVELRDFVRNANHDHCLLNLHCKRNNPLCNTCVNAYK